MKMFRWVSAWCVPLIVFWACQQPVQISGSGSETVLGYVTAPDGSAAVGATVKLWQRAGEFDTIAAGTAVTDNEGKYAFNKVAAGTYSVYAQSSTANTVGRATGVSYVKTTEPLLMDTIGLNFPGQVGGEVLYGSSPVAGATCYIRYSPHFDITGTGGRFGFGPVVPGECLVRCVAPSPYAQLDTLITVAPHDSMHIILRLQADPSAPPPAVGQLTSVYDTALQLVRLNWQPVRVPDIEGYVVYRTGATGLAEPVSPLLSDTFYVDTVATADGQLLRYYVDAMDSSGSPSVRHSPVAAVTAVPRSAVATDLEISLLDTASGSTARQALLVFYSNPGRIVDTIKWYCDSSSAAVRAVSVRSRAGRDTLIPTFTEPGSHTVTVVAVDEAGSRWTESIVVDISAAVRPVGVWQALPDAPLRGRVTVCGTVGDTMYVAGVGAGDTQRAYGIYRMHGGGEGWERVTSLPTNRQGCAAAIVGRHVYTAGGEMIDGRHSTAVEIFSIDSARWSDGTRLEVERSYLAAVVSGGRFVVMGGLPKYLDVVWELDGAVWRRHSLMTAARADFACVVIDSTIFAVGGKNDAGPMSSVECSGGVQGLWLPARSLPLPLSAPAGAVIDRKIYIAGGSSPSAAATDTVLVYDPADDTWTTGPSLPAPRRAMGLVSCGGDLYAVGGIDAAGQAVGTVWVFRPALPR